MKKYFSPQLSLLSKLTIIISILIKLLRGLFYKITFKNSKGLILVGWKTDISFKNNISVGKMVKFEKGCEVQGLCKRGLSFGNNVTIGAFSMIRPSSYYGMDIGEGMKIGDNSSIGPYSYIGCSGFIEIGSNVMMGPRVSLFAENHIFEDVKQSIKTQGVVQRGIVLEDDCWIGSGAIILDGVKIGKGSVIGAGTVVSKSVEPYSVVVGAKNRVLYNRLNSSH